MFNYSSEQLGCDVQFLFWVLWEIFVLLKQIFDHAIKYFQFTLYIGFLEFFQQIQNFVN